LQTPNQTAWEVEAAHIVPHSSNGKDDIWNGIALCRIHHWAFDVGWFTLTDDWRLLVSPEIQNVPRTFGMVNDYDYIRHTLSQNRQILLPAKRTLYPHKNSIAWHREHLFGERK
jgi:putative restriction endonuclease